MWIVRVEPVPSTVIWPSGASVWLDDVPVTELRSVPSPTLKVTLSVVSSFVDLSLMFSTDGCSSKAPMSTVAVESASAESAVRGKPVPRWSVIRPAAVAAVLSPASRAGLVGASARVFVGPPLLASEPTCGSVPRMLLPLSVTPEESALVPALLSAMMVFLAVVVTPFRV